MFYKKLIGAVAAVALATTATAAAAAPAAPSPATEQVDADSNLRRTGILIPLAALVAIGAAIYLLFLKGDDEKAVTPS